ncbi:AMP-binding protein [Agromyces italicus]|uniref:AMP-binding protein n=1 Tax=Agromyces italicus TaxID=279572 RepID=UPI0003B59AF4|nr:AMP-binding protein [Agromyces italicus]
MPSSAPALGVSTLGGRAEDPALVADGRVIDYAELVDRVGRRSAELGTTRRLVMIEAGNTLEPVVTYLAALEGGHPVLFVPAGGDETARRNRAALTERFDPDVIARTGADDRGERHWILDERRRGTRHELHPELALLASTSGSTGSPKLVRLSAENLRSNAAAIAEYLRLSPADRAATTLPLQYCYGLSVVNSHLLAGASLLLTERSVTDESFWHEASEHRITSFAGVPYTFELLEADGFADRELPSLRYLTQAGGRLAPEAVRRIAELGERRGFELFVMYGQTEATARMAYLPPELAASAAGAIGRPIPGGRLRIAGLGEVEDEADASSTASIEGDGPLGEGTGELVYEGPNVMLGYAEAPADFALGRTVHELRTGDLARRRPDGLFEIVGRAVRFAKVFGLRLDLDRVERLLAEEGLTARAATDDARLLVFATSDRVVARVRERAASLTGLPSHVVAGYAVAEFPRTSSGKPDTAALVRFAADHDRVLGETTGTSAPTASDASERVRDLFATLLGRADAGFDDSFAGLGGDSLSYIEVSLRLEELLGALPREWPRLTARELGARGGSSPADAANRAVDQPDVTASSAACQPDVTASSAAHRTAGARAHGAPPEASAPNPAGPRRRPWAVRLETPAVLRAAAIVLIVGTHADLFMLKGGAHLLLAVAGYNLARFQLAAVPGATRVRRLTRSAVQLAVPAALWIGAVALVTGRYGPTTALLVNNLVPSDGRWNEQWQFWFLEAAVWTLVGLALLFAVRAVDRFERRAPFGFALGALAVALAARFAISGPHAEYVERYSAPVVIWLIALGWLVARADTTARRIVVSAVAVASSFGFFGEPGREAIVAGGVLALIWIPALPLPRLIVPAVATLAGASMFVYLTHWQVYPPFETSAPWLGTLLSLAVGVLAWRAYLVASGQLSRMTDRARRGFASRARLRQERLERSADATDRTELRQPACGPAERSGQPTGAVAAIGG